MASTGVRYNLIRDRLFSLRHEVDLLDNSREKSCALTKLDEFRHWIEDDRFKTSPVPNDV